MQGFIKRFSDFSTAKAFRAVEWDIALRSVQDEVSTVVVVAGDVDAGDVGDWLIMGGALLRIESVQAGSSTTTVKCRDLASAFARTFLLQDLMEDETISYFIMDTLGQQFEAADDAAYALPYLTASATTEGDIAYHAPETDDYGRFEFDEYLRMVARVYNIHLSWSITGADELSITVGRGTMRGGQIVLGAGADQLAETPIFASAEVAKITVLQKTTAEDGTETVSKSDRYLYTDGTFGASATGGTRAEGGWEYLTVGPSATADEIEDKVAQRFERGMSDSKISFFSARELDVGAPVVLRVAGRKYSGYITYKGIKSSDKRYFYRCGNRPVTLTEKLRAVEKTAQTVETTAGGTSGGGGGTGGGAVTSVNGKTGAVTIGPEVVSGEDITPSQVDIPNGPTSIARLGATTDGRGVMELRRADGTLGVKAYANTASGGEIDVHNGDGARRAALYTTTEGDGRLRLWDAAGTAHTLTAERIDIYPCNPNLLDNWCFLPGCIVNQRGESSYAKPDASNDSSKFGYDRWVLRNVTATAQTNGLKLQKNGGTPYLLQTLENANALKGKTVTASFLLSGITGTSTDFYAAVSNGTSSIEVDTVFGSSTSCKNGLISVTCNIPSDATINYFNVLIRRNGNDSTAFTLVAAKLELGTQQTLAHKDASGNWVLNAIPNYSEELTKCLRYYRRSWTGTISASGAVPFVRAAGANSQPGVNWETPMRTAPTITVRSWGSGGVNHIRDWSSNADVAISGTAYVSPYGFSIYGLGSLTAGKAYPFHYEASAEL